MIEISDLDFSYKKHQPLFEKLSLHLSGGKCYGLLGKNGAGKTTLLKAIAGLVFPHSGVCLFENIPVKQRKVSFLQQIFYVPEVFSLPSLKPKTFENRYAHFYPQFNHELLGNNLDLFQISNDKPLTQMSYGQQKKFLLAFALASGVKCYLLDEPTNGLDITSKEQFLQVIKKITDGKKTFLISTHQTKELGDLLQTVIILDKGSIAFYQDWEIVTKKIIGVKTPTHIDQALFAQQQDDASWKCLVKAQDASPEFQTFDISLELIFQAVVDRPPKNILYEAVGTLKEEK